MLGTIYIPVLQPIFETVPVNIGQLVVVMLLLLLLLFVPVVSTLIKKL